MKKIVISILIIAGICMSSCSTDLSAESVSETETVPTTETGAPITYVTLEPVTDYSLFSDILETSSLSPEEIIQNMDYDVSAMGIDISLDEAVDICGSCLGVDITSYDADESGTIHFDYDDYRVYYYEDYQCIVSESAQHNYDGHNVFGLTGTDLHILRRLSIDRFDFNEYEDELWAEVGYREEVNYILENYDETDGSYSDGYCFGFSTAPDSSEFRAAYFFGQNVVCYSYINDGSDSKIYMDYLSFCEALGLPASDIMTDIILGE